MAFLKHVVFSLSDFSFQRYDSPNLKKTRKEWSYLYLSDISLQRYHSANFLPILKKRFFTQLAVVHCDPSSSRVWLMVGGGGRTSICGMAKD